MIPPEDVVFILNNSKVVMSQLTHQEIAFILGKKVASVSLELPEEMRKHFWYNYWREVFHGV